MIKLFQFEPAFALPNASPFCMKLETWLRMAELPYEMPPASLRNFGRAPKGKLPYIEDHGRLLADTSFIIDYLKATYGDGLDAWLSPGQAAVALAFQRLIEEDLYWAIVHTRWIQSAGWEQTRAAFFGTLPAPLRWILPVMARRGLRQELLGHGMGRHTQDQIMAIGQRDITALADQLGRNPYMMGEQPCSLDASAYAFLANLIWPPVESALKRHALAYPQIVAYCERMRDRYFA